MIRICLKNLRKDNEGDSLEKWIIKSAKEK